jgi:RHS repeat-associated protein
VTLEAVEYVWNNANLLTDVITKDSLGTVTKTVSYRYDGLGRRIGKFVDDNGDTLIDRSETFIYDGAGLLSSSSPNAGEGASAIRIPGVNGALGQYGWVDDVVLVYSDADGSGPGTSTLTSRNLYGPLVDQIFASDDATGNVLWALTDQLGTPRDWADRDSTTGTTSVALHTRFTAFGAIESVADGSGAPLSSSILPPSSFTGQLYDADVELYYYRARWYDPVLGKFLSDDPMSFAAGDANVSRYVGNGVSVASDPTGLNGMDIKMDIWIRARNRENRAKIDYHYKHILPLAHKYRLNPHDLSRVHESGFPVTRELATIWSEMRNAALEVWNEPGGGFDGNNHMCFQYAEAMCKAGNAVNNHIGKPYIIGRPRVANVNRPWHFVVDIFDPSSTDPRTKEPKKFITLHVGSGINPMWHTTPDNDWPIKLTLPGTSYDPPANP